MKTILLPFHDENAGRTALDAATLVSAAIRELFGGLLVQETPQLSFDRGMTVPAEYLTRRNLPSSGDSSLMPRASSSG